MDQWNQLDHALEGSESVKLGAAVLRDKIAGHFCAPVALDVMPCDKVWILEFPLCDSIAPSNGSLSCGERVTSKTFLSSITG